MQKQNGGRPTILPKMYEEPLFSQIIDKIESGCNDREIYTNLHCSAKTFRKWRDDNIKAYDEAKSIARGNLLELAESALASKLTVRTLKETETIHHADGNLEKRYSTGYPGRSHGTCELRQIYPRPERYYQEGRGG